MADRYNRIQEIDKFNPYHDARGRFASADNASSFTIRTRAGYQQGQANRAISREKERHSKESQKKPKAMTLDEYLGSKGLSFPISDFMDDKLRNPHGLTARQRKQLERDADKARNEYADKRNKAIQEYNEKVKNGEIRPKTNVERLIRAAHGHEDNESVQAARRALARRGIDWKTAKVDKSIDYIVEIGKFNPYHDALGRFATSSSHTLFTVRTKDPKKQHWADMAIAREKDKYQSGKQNYLPERKKPQQNKKPESDSKQTDTIAGVKRGEPMTHDQANHGKANPNFDKGGGYRTNCQSCVVTYEARLRGYDVVTKPNTPGSKLEELASNSSRAWIDPKTGEVLDRKSRTRLNAKNAKQARKELEEKIKPGERYTFGHQWKGRHKYGHIIRADRDEEGKLRLFDPQSGKTYQDAELDRYLSQCKYTTKSYGFTYNVAPQILRVDNLDFNPEYVNAIMGPA